MPTQKIEVPEGKMESPSSILSIGVFKVETISEYEGRAQRKYELLVKKDDNLDLWVKNEHGEEKILISMHTDFDDQTNKHIGKMKIEEADLFAKLEKSSEFDALFDSYMENVRDLSTDYLSKLDRESNNHKIRLHEIDLGGGKKTIEMIHQQQDGDCVLANFINTWSIAHDGRIPCTINEARRMAVKLRKQEGADATEIENPDSGLKPGDTMDLYALIYGYQWQEEDVLMVSGENIDENQLKLKILDILDYLETYASKTCTTNLGRHSWTIKKLQGDNYLIVDPLNKDGIWEMNTDQVMEYLFKIMKNKKDHENFFFFLRNEGDK